MTYDELIDIVPRWLYAENRSLSGDIETIVSQAHQQLINVLDHDLFRTIITGETLTVSSGGVIDLGSQVPRVLEVRGIRLKWRGGSDDWTPIMRRDLEAMTMLYARNRPRRPVYYSEYNGFLILKAFPTPDRDYDLSITANVEPPVLSPTQQTNVISLEFPRALETATLRHACLYQKNWEDAQMYEKEMMGAVTEANAQVQRRRRDDSATRPIETSNVSGA